MALLKVSSRSNPNAVAGAFAGVVREQGRVDVQVVGAGAMNQAVKAIAIARAMLATQGIDLVCAPAFAEIEIDGQPRTAMQIAVERRDREANAAAPQLSQPSDLRIETSAGGVTLTADATGATPAEPVSAPEAALLTKPVV